MNIGVDFATGAGLRALLRKNAFDKYQEAHPYSCLMDNTCVPARMIHKNNMQIVAIVSSGSYVIEFYD